MIHLAFFYQGSIECFMAICFIDFLNEFQFYKNFCQNRKLYLPSKSGNNFTPNEKMEISEKEILQSWYSS